MSCSFFYLFMMFVVFFLSVFVMLVNNMFFWWGVFLFMTLLIVFLNKGESSYVSIFNYFVLQESLGLLFLLLFFGFFPSLLLMIKLGASPFHFWVIKVVGNMYGFNLVWFLTLHKLPFLMVMLQLFFLGLVFFLLLGLVFCLLQMFVLKTFKSLLVVSSIESFNWILLGLVVSFFNVFFMFFYYVMLMVVLMYSLDLLSSLSYSYSWELMLVFMNVPFSLGFFVKIFLLMEFLKDFSFFVVLILFMMFLSVLSFSFWLVFLSSKSFNFFKYNSVYFFLVFFDSCVGF
uniref:NADH dehydrogenase subunit 2 n=1 Tax=Parafilaroides normani TaxID=1519083 RepID=A0A075QTJ9_PARNR|nr:NADH dehydrogenase subunit 2 [Parafilaroides normani]AIG23805.1 NADH dehydrogenase subunit 2 [Parafilaroides normani]